jgi:exopolysaccharide biosynthesis predicted pyruvyltransferase EpsI
MSLFFSRSSSYADSIGSYFRVEPHLFLLSEMPGNIGDHLIWEGSQRLLKNQFIDFEYISVKNVIDNRTSYSESTLVIPGNAAMTSRWHEWLPARVIAAATHFKKVVILPSEYEPEIDIVHKALSLKNVWAFAREEKSYTRIKQYGRAAIALDPALYAFDFETVNHLERSDEDLGVVLLALRTDAGSLLPINNLTQVELNNDISLTCGNLDEFLDLIQSHDSVITDRLHVAVASLMLGKTVRYVDPYNQKISRYAKFNFGDEFGKSFQQRDESWLLRRGFVERMTT